MKNIIINLLLILIFGCTFTEDTPKTAEKTDILEQTYTVTYKSDYGTVPSKITGLKKGDKLTDEQLPELTTDGYTFAGWYNGETKVEAGYTIISNLELAAIWTANTYTITYELDGGTNAESNPTNYTVKTETITLAKARRTGYTFVGWYIDEACTIAKTEITKGSIENMTLYAKWGIAADYVVKVIEALLGEGPHDITVTGTITSDTITSINNALINERLS